MLFVCLQGAFMQMRTLGSLGIPVSPITLGGNVFGWTSDEAK